MIIDYQNKRISFLKSDYLRASQFDLNSGFRCNPTVEYSQEFILLLSGIRSHLNIRKYDGK